MFGAKSTYINEEPHRSISKFCLDSEEILLATREHWVQILGPVLVAALSLILAAPVIYFVGPYAPIIGHIVLFLVLPAVFGWLIFHLWNWAHDWFIVTNSRVLRVTGYFVRRVAMMPISKVTDLKFNKSIWGEILDYGEFVFESAGQDQALSHIPFVPKPDEIYAVISQPLFGSDRQLRTSERGAWFKRWKKKRELERSEPAETFDSFNQSEPVDVDFTEEIDLTHDTGDYRHHDTSDLSPYELRQLQARARREARARQRNSPPTAPARVLGTTDSPVGATRPSRDLNDEPY